MMKCSTVTTKKKLARHVKMRGAVAGYLMVISEITSPLCPINLSNTDTNKSEIHEVSD